MDLPKWLKLLIFMNDKNISILNQNFYTSNKFYVIMKKINALGLVNSYISESNGKKIRFYELTFKGDLLVSQLMRIDFTDKVEKDKQKIIKIDEKLLKK